MLNEEKKCGYEVGDSCGCPGNKEGAVSWSEPKGDRSWGNACSKEGYYCDCGRYWEGSWQNGGNITHGGCGAGGYCLTSQNCASNEGNLKKYSKCFQNCCIEDSPDNLSKTIRETLREELLLEDKKFRESLEACREEKDRNSRNENCESVDGGRDYAYCDTRACDKFYRNYT